MKKKTALVGRQRVALENGILCRHYILFGLSAPFILGVAWMAYYLLTVRTVRHSFYFSLLLCGKKRQIKVFMNQIVHERAALSYKVRAEHLLHQTQAAERTWRIERKRCAGRMEFEKEVGQNKCTELEMFCSQ
jgi:hypothetical protein